MSYGDPEMLFQKIDLHNVMEAHRQHSLAEVQQIPRNALLNTPTADTVDTICNKYRLDVPTLHRDEAEADQREGQVRIVDYFGDRGRGDGTMMVTGTIIELTVPFTGDKDFFFIRPTTFNSAPPYAAVEQGQLVVRVSGRTLDAAQVKTGLNKTLDEIEQYLNWQRTTANEFNRSLAQPITNAVEQRKQKLLNDQNLVAGLGFNLKTRGDAPKTFVAPLNRAHIPLRREGNSSAPFIPEPVLDDANYQHILKVIENMTLVMERSPTAFAKMGEEDIRQHYLVQLNGQFEGAATGETFNFHGKTDILIRVEGKNIFIAECKFWKGEKAFLETINQILGYLSWRDTKAAVLIFNRNRDFTGVLNTLVEAANRHPHKKRGPAKEGETRFRYVFGNPSDHSREVILTIMAFNIPGDP